MDGRTLLKRLRDEDWYLGDTEGASRQYVHPERAGVITVCVRHTEILGPSSSDRAIDAAEVDVDGDVEVVVETTDTGVSAYVVQLGGCVATGRDEEDVRARMDQALTLHRQGLRAVAT